MYQGKFDAKAKGQTTPGQTLDQILTERAADNARRAAKKAARSAKSGSAPASVSQKPTAKAPQGGPRRSAAAQRPVSQPQSAQAPAKRPTRPQTENQMARSPKKRGPRIGGVVFYSMYFLMIFVFFIGIFLTLNWLNGWLKDFEAAQPTVICQQVFDQLFANPDWARLYRQAGDPTGSGVNKYDTEFEGVDEYAAYMSAKTTGKQLEYVETSGGLSGKKYIVRLDGEKVATFTLMGQTESLTDIPDWKLGEIELFFTRSQSIRIRKLENHQAQINGTFLDDSIYTIQRASTKADASLPAENQVRTTILEVDNLLAEPKLVVYDQTGAPIEVRYNSDSGMYEEQISAIAMTEAERSAVFGALESYAGFMINASGSRTALAKYFESGSQTYKDILQMGSELWMNSDRGHQFLNEEIMGYTKHSDTLFSVRAGLTMHVNNKDGTEKDFNVTQSMYFTLKNGNWVCREMTNEDLTAPVGEVRLTFCDANGTQLSSSFYSTSAESVTAPVVEVPAGMVFSGWSRIDVAPDGTKTWNVMFQADEAGNISLPAGYVLEPMTLYPLFEKA